MLSAIFEVLLYKHYKSKHNLISNRFKRRPNGRAPDRGFKDLLRRYFGGQRVLALPKDAVTQAQLGILEQDSLWESLRARIFRGSHVSKIDAAEHELAFSATHFKALFHLTCNYLARENTTPFSFLKASRLVYPSPRDFSSYKTNFLREIERLLVESFALPFIESTMNIDSYPPGIHSKHGLKFRVPPNFKFKISSRRNRPTLLCQYA